jgi:hypothetical protein
MLRPGHNGGADSDALARPVSTTIPSPLASWAAAGRYLSLVDPGLSRDKQVREYPNRPRHWRRPRYRPRHRPSLAQSGWRAYGGVRTDVAAKELAEESEATPP